MILFVCTGNTCRSPMAAALARRLGGVDADSAGLAAWPGDAASPGAIRAMEAYGADLSNHEAKQVSSLLMDRASLVYAMTAGHAQRLRQLFPGQAGKIRVLTPEIPDPFGGSDGMYALCAQRIVEALRQAGVIPMKE